MASATPLGRGACNPECWNELACDCGTDALELKCALRVATGAEVSLNDCRRLVAATDKNGDGVIDFKEFKVITNSKLRIK